MKPHCPECELSVTVAHLTPFTHIHNTFFLKGCENPYIHNLHTLNIRAGLGPKHYFEGKLGYFACTHYFNNELSNCLHFFPYESIVCEFRLAAQNKTL